MADMKKFLDQSGVSTLWGQVKAEIAKIPVYDDAQVKADIDANKAAIEAEVARADAAEKANAKAISDLTTSVANDIANAVASIVDGADSSYDTLKEIAAWIAAHPESVAELNAAIGDNAAAIKVNEEAIADLAVLVGDKAVAAQISEAIAAAGHAAGGQVQTGGRGNFRVQPLRSGSRLGGVGSPPVHPASIPRLFAASQTQAAGFRRGALPPSVRAAGGVYPLRRPGGGDEFPPAGRNPGAAGE